MQITKGQRLKLADVLQPTQSFQLDIRLNERTLPCDFACFGLNATGKLLADEYMTFFNQKQTPCGALQLLNADQQAASFTLALARLPASIDRLVFTLAIDGDGTLRQLHSGSVCLIQQGQTALQFSFVGGDFEQERALLLFEMYRHQESWRISATAQGFNGGLPALVTHFGAIVAAEEAPVASDKRVELEKRVASQAPQLVNLVKQAKVSLQKVGLDEHRAKVCLCLDISGSMRALYAGGLVQKLAERVLALACRFDDDGEIDVFLFGAKVHQPAAMNIENCNTYIQGLRDKHPLENDTRYGAAMTAIRKHYFGDFAFDEKKPTKTTGDLPIYVMFVTDGSTTDTSLTEKQVRASSYQPIFWQFMGIGKGRKSKAKKFAAFATSDFPLLEKLDELSGRLIDNADFFTVMSPDEHDDASLYEMMMVEYPQWVKQAKAQGLLK